MVARTLTRDIEWKNGVKWPRGETLDLTYNVWGSICDDLGVTLPEISYEAGEAAAEQAEKIAALEAEIVDLKKQLAGKPKSAQKRNAKDTE